MKKKCQEIFSIGSQFDCWNWYRYYLLGSLHLVVLLLQLLLVKLYLTFRSQRYVQEAKINELSQLQPDYRDYFFRRLALYKVNSPAELSKEKQRQFCVEMERNWAKYKIANRVLGRLLHTDEKLDPDTTPIPIYEAVGRVIKSEPNKEQSLDLKIGFRPNAHFVQGDNYLYPVIKMPEPKATLKLPRNGRSNQKGYTESRFFSELRHQIAGVDVLNDVHMVVPNSNRPYEPDIVVRDKKLNLYIDIEIDEPYDGHYRRPTHYIDVADQSKKDNVRDRFFIESGWVVMRFTEKQVHCQERACIALIKSLLNSLYNRNLPTVVEYEREEQWSYNQCIAWQAEFYRENYLGIDRFVKQDKHTEIVVDPKETERIEQFIRRTKVFDFKARNNSIEFDEESHKYMHPKDKTGNAEYISTTTAIGYFFPFNQKRYIERKAIREHKTEEQILAEQLAVGQEASEKGTFLHVQIERFFNKTEFDADTTEFSLFLHFYENEIKKRGLRFFDAEKRIFSNRYNVAGTIDSLFKKADKDEYVMLDWKRSKKLIIDGRPKIYGYGYALSELSHLDNSSYYKYCLQQNIYKIIVETECSMKISSMKLVVLHENYPTYYVVDVPDMKKEAMVILNSLNHKI